MDIKNPIEWSGSQLVHAVHAIAGFGRSLGHIAEHERAPAPVVRRIGLGDLAVALLRGIDDFKAYRSDVLVIGIIYAVIGVFLARAAFRADLLPLLFPLASGFAIVAPFAAVGLYEMSRLREQGLEPRWSNALDVVKEPGFGAVAVLGLVLVALFGIWIAAAWWIYQLTLGPAMPSSLGSFVGDVFLTSRGHVMILVGVAVGFVFAAVAMIISVVSFPMLLDRDVGLDTALHSSFRAVAANPGVMAAWGLTVAAALLLSALSLFVGLAVVLPVLGHATWHLYRKLIEE